MTRVIVLSAKILLLTIVMFACFVMTSLIVPIDMPEGPTPPVEPAALALLFVTFVGASLLFELTCSARWRSWRLVGFIALLHFGIESLMSQTDTILFREGIGITLKTTYQIIANGALRAIIFAPLVVLVAGRFRAESPPCTLEADEQSFSKKQLLLRWSLLPAVYIAVYLLFGYYVAWQSPVLREFYSDSRAIDPFVLHMQNLVTDRPLFIPAQYLRGVLWLGMAWLIVTLTSGGRWRKALRVGLLFGLLPTLPLLIPNPFMPETVRFFHLIETAPSMFLYGAFAGAALLYNRSAQPQQASDS